MNSEYYSLLLTSYFTFALQGLIFVVDSNDRERAAEAREELSKMVCLVLTACLAFHKYILFYFVVGIF